MSLKKSVGVSHPGAILREDILPNVNINSDIIAQHLGIPLVEFEAVLSEAAPIDAELAVKLGKLFGNDARFWLNLQQNYDLSAAEKSVDISSIPSLWP